MQGLNAQLHFSPSSSMLLWYLKTALVNFSVGQLLIAQYFGGTEVLSDCFPLLLVIL